MSDKQFLRIEIILILNRLNYSKFSKKYNKAKIQRFSFFAGFLLIKETKRILNKSLLQTIFVNYN